MPETGAWSGMTVNYPDFTTVVQPITSRYFLGAVLLPGGLIGKARYLLRAACMRLQREVT